MQDEGGEVGEEFSAPQQMQVRSSHKSGKIKNKFKVKVNKL